MGAVTANPLLTGSRSAYVSGSRRNATQNAFPTDGSATFSGWRLTETPNPGESLGSADDRRSTARAAVRSWIGDQPPGTEVSGWLDARTPSASAYAIKARGASDMAAGVSQSGSDRGVRGGHSRAPRSATGLRCILRSARAPVQAVRPRHRVPR